jgi:hypothetical protein
VPKLAGPDIELYVRKVAVVPTTMYTLESLRTPAPEEVPYAVNPAVFAEPDAVTVTFPPDSVAFIVITAWPGVDTIDRQPSNNKRKVERIIGTPRKCSEKVAIYISNRGSKPKTNEH